MEKDGVALINSTLPWVALGIGILANFLVSVVLIPFLLIFSGSSLIVAIALIGMCFGFIIDLIVKMAEKVHRSKFVISEVFIPAIALINIYIITRLSNKMIVLLGLKNTVGNPILISSAYVIAFVLPFIVRRVIFSRESK